MDIEERRAHPRFAVDEQAWLSIVDHGLAMPCRILDLSMQGCRVCAGGSLPQGLKACIEITFTINGIPFRLGGRVMRSTGSGELGIAFVGMSMHRQVEWADVVGEVRTLAVDVRAKADAPDAA